MKTVNCKVLTLTAALATVGLAACDDAPVTIDRTQPNALDKSMFEGIWYHRTTIVESDPEAVQRLGISSVFEGISGNMEKIRWDIQENLLVAYRSYEAIPYAEGLTDEGRDFFGSPVAAYTIESHFDIQREYNTTTGVPSNVISENTADRPWHQRRFMRVDWSQNVVGQPTLFGFGSLNGMLSGWSNNAFFVQPDDRTSPDRPVITRDYFDITNMYALSPSQSYCLFQLLFNSVPRCGVANVKARLSFRKVDPTNDYEALYYPDRLEYRDDDGNPLVLDDRDLECEANDSPDFGDCFVRGYNYDGRFGNFRINRVAFSTERFQTRAGRVFLAGRYDLWEDSFDETGARIPFSARTPQPVVYYTNPKVPEYIREASENIASWWAKPFNESVAFRMGFTNEAGNLPDVEAYKQEMVEAYGGEPSDWDMFQHRRNSCNRENVIAYAASNDMQSVIDEVAGGNEQIFSGNVERVCAALQYEDLQRGKTLDPSVARRTGRELAFTWERLGDLRYNFDNYVIQLTGGPLGVAQFGQDPETGEFVSNIANTFGDAIDRFAGSSLDLIQWLNGDLATEDILRGNVTREFTQIPTRDYGIRDELKNAMDKDMDSTFANGGGGQAQGGGAPVGGGATDKDRYEAVFSGSDLEREFLISESMLRVFAGPGLYQPSDGISLPGNPDDGGGAPVLPGEISEEALEMASPVNWLFDMENSPFEQALVELGSNGFDMASFFDPNVSGLADEVKGQDRDRIYQTLQTLMFSATQAHEIGHAVGLRHNFRASMDPLNYRPEFWSEFYGQGNAGRPTAEQPTRAQEYKYASIMDYDLNFNSSAFHGLGSYDEAAARFMYGQLVDVWDSTKIAIPDPRKYSTYALRCGRVDDNYRDAGYNFENLAFIVDPEDLPKVFSQTPVSEECTQPGIDFDSNEDCDTEMDELFRQIASSVDNNAEAFGFPTLCITGNATRDAINYVTTEIEPRTDLIYGARVMAPVEELIGQETAAFAANITEDEKGVDWSQWKHEVPYGYCSDRFAGFSNPFCQRWDHGWDFVESVQNHISNYDRDYLWRSFQRDRSAFGNPLPLLMRLIFRRFRTMSDVYQYFVFTRQGDDDLGRIDDWQEAAYLGANFLERVLLTPEPGNYCLDDDNVYRLEQTLPAGTPCDEPFEVGVGFGAGAFLEDAWNEEYFFNKTTLGTYWDKWAAMWVMTRSSGNFAFDLSQVFDNRAFALPYLRTWQDPFLQRWSSLIRNDHDGYRSRVVPIDPNDPNSERFVRYTPLFDEEFDTDRGTLAGESVRGWMRDNNFPEIEPSFSYDLRLWALAFGLSSWSSSFDRSVDYYRLSKVSIPGTPDATFYSDDVEVIRFVDPETQLEYEAPCIEPFTEPTFAPLIDRGYYGNVFDRRRGNFHDWSVGCALIKDLTEYVDTVYEPRRAACVESAPNTTPELATTSECTNWERARVELADQVGFLNQLRRFTVRAEGVYR